MSVEFFGAVNLLPWREREVRLQRFKLLRRFALSVVAGLLAVGFFTWQLQHSLAQVQQEAVRTQAQLASNGKRADAAQMTVNEIARWKGFAALEPTARESHMRVLHFLRDISAQSVTGIALSSVEFNGDVIEVKGTTKSKSLAVDFVRGLKARGWTAAAPTVAYSDSKFKAFQFLIKPKAKKKK